VLKTLALEPLHGYGIGQRIEQVSSGIFKVTLGSLYPALQRLEKDGLVEAEWKASEKERDQAKEVQLRNREQFLKAFSDGMAVLGYERDKEGNGRFLLGHWDEEWGYESAPGEEEETVEQ